MDIEQQINITAKITKDGGLVIFPTETVYGLGENALNPDAMAKIFSEKERSSFNSSGFHILRHGIITANQIGKVLPKSSETISNNCNPIAPGLLKSPYKPSKQLYFTDEHIQYDKSKAGLLSFCGKHTEGYKVVEILTENKNLKEAAVNFFKCLHKLEEASIEYIIAEPVPEIGIGIAIMNRLRKAAFKEESKQFIN